MTENHFHRLLVAVLGAFLVPFIGYLLGLLWSKSIATISGVPPNQTLRKASATFFLALPVFFLSVIVRLDYQSLRSWYLSSPLIVAAMGFLILVVCPLVLVYVIYRLWASPMKRNVDARHLSQR